ncbi:DEAD/DEAH box helicase [Heterostelium album PN500]|uniref:RNA helicase n=1 Tax=Heterostelium pallidum (strain ATCC 26659 / Pp 5 / PN500) TaxID=670386 RepID=D3BVM0_HETP5|nr:DEAD/DEAH box helicase [Heterostelium album PN500]EFA74523.1 DEAD/DEAH box helicase [Heterostelium album PN500]|eukprot:XP_020426657.1 DEAD/DEAH box helicase [Heterostelium album PN500]
MSDVLARNKQYEYKANSNLVIHSERNPRDLREPKGEPETLWGKLGGQMGDRVSYSKPTELLDRHQQLKRKNNDKVVVDTGVVQKKQRGGSRGGDASGDSNDHASGGSHRGTSNILSATDVYEGLYRPKTRETKIVYEQLLSFVQGYIGDQPLEIVKGATDEILAILKNDKMRAPEKRTEITKLLKGMSEERFAELTNLSRAITDYAEATGTSGVRNDNLDDPHGVAVIIDEDEDEDNQSDYEIKDIDEDDEDQDEDNNTGGVDKDNENDNNGEIKSNERDNSSSNGNNSSSSSSSGSLNPMDIDAFWIQRKISTFESDPLQSQKLAEQVLNILRQNDLRRCETDLVGLFDFERFDFIKLLLKNRKTILYCTLLAKSENDQERKKLEDEMSQDSELYSLLNTLKGTSMKLDSNGNGVDKKNNAQQQKKKTAGISPDNIKTPKRTLDLEGLKFQQGGHLMTNKKFQFPAGSKRETYKGYEEIHVPAKVTPFDDRNERLVEIKELPEWARVPFKGFDKLNRVQSRLYEWAFKSSDNLLLSAPTSAGKTNVAMLTILHELGKHIDPETGVIDLDSFKIVYIAPMKSLVQEMVANFSNRLASYGIVVKELTGDQSLTNKQISETQIIVTTPEKWDIITRKSGERAYTQLVRLIIIDEIHLLHDERGPVLECIVARTLRTIESTQEMVRLVGLSATLPNYEDVATFLRVKPEGVFYFDSSYRPIPLEQQYIGISDRGIKQLQLLNDITFKKVNERAGTYQILIFVHSRRETAKTGRDIRDRALEADIIGKLLKRKDSVEILKEEAEKTAKSADLKDLLPYGIGIHHAGLSRSDRTLVEELFADNHIQVLISTATLAWGVNLPAHTVIIKGTQVYNPEKGWTELSPLDVTQMLGRAGRPPFDTEGEGIIVTSQNELQFYLSLINTQLSIESQFISRLADNLNAEIVLGTIQTVRDAVQWLGYTYLFICMLRNPPLYEISYDEIAEDPELEQRRLDLIHTAALQLDKNSLIKYDRKSGHFQTTELGKVASHYYVTNASMSVYQEHLKPTMSDIEFFRLFSLSSEFKSVVVRDGEKAELEKLLERVPIPVKESIDEPSAKINVLLQAYISNLKLEGFALMVDMFYIAQSASRICRALFEIVIKKGWAQVAKKILGICKMVDRKMWASQSPLRQFKEITPKILNQLERRSIPIEDLYEYNSQQLGSAIQNAAEGKKLYKLIHHFPKLDLTAHVQPILRGLLRVDLTLTPDFEFDEKYHDNSIGWWVIVEDVDGEKILYYEYFMLKKKMMEEDQTITFTVPLSDPLPPQYYVRVVADRWIGAEYNLSVSFRHLILPEKYQPCSKLHDLIPLSLDSLKDSKAKEIFNFKYFNAIQTQVFDCLYKGDDNALIAAPANSGKTVCAELAVLRELKKNPNAKCVYIAPMQDLATLRLRDWTFKFQNTLGKRVVELTGEPITDNKLLESASIVIATAEKWDILSRRWKQRKSIQNISLFVVDELHMIGGGADGAILEIIVSRMRFIAIQTGSPIRIVALSSPVANARDLAEWIGATPSTMFNLHPDVRPVPLEIQIQGFDFPHYNARLLAMAKPTIYAVSHNRRGQSLVFVPTRKLSRSLAKDLIVHVDSEDDIDKKRYLRCSEEDLEKHLQKIESVALKQALQWGVGFYHEGLTAQEKRTVEILFKSGAIQVLIATHSVCWSLDVYASLVVIMGTQLYQGKSVRYVDYPINDVLQMIARSGQQGRDDVGRCLLLCHSPKKEYYKMFLNQPLPVESHLDHFLADHINSEIVTKTIVKKQDALDYLTWTFLYRRFTQNPNYYNLTGISHLHLSEHMSELVENTLVDLEQANCITIQEEDDGLSPLNLGIIASYYYLKYTTIELFASSLKSTTKRKGILEILSTAPEFAEIPIRHREEQLLQRMAAHLPLKIEKPTYGEAHTKVNILLQSHFSRKAISADLHMDLQFILENATRLLQAIVDVISSSSWLNPALAAMELSQMCTQAMWDNDSPLRQLPHMTADRLEACKKAGLESIFDLLELEDSSRDKLLRMSNKEMEDVATVCNRYPDIELSYNIQDEDDIHAGDSMLVEVMVQREVDEESNPDQLNIVYAPYYPKEKIGGWWVIIGDPKTNQLHFIKRLTFTARAKVKLEFPAPAMGKHQLTLYLMSDSYSGCDQEYKLDIDVKAANVDEDEDEDGDQNMED